MATIPSGNKVELQVGVDVSPMKPGLREGELEIKRFTDTVVTQAGKASRSIDSLGAASQDTSAKLSRSQQAYVANLQRVVAAEEAGGRNTVEYQRKLAALRNVPAEFSEPLLKQLEAVQKGQVGAGKGLADFQQSLRATRAQANLTANALRQVPAQFTDIVVSLASGQAPLTVLLQQGGQLKDVFGGVGAAVQALSKYIVGLINPFTVLAGAVVGLAVIYKKASDEQRAYANALIFTGNAAGGTTDQLTAMAAQISATTELSTGQAADLIAQFAAAGVAVDKISQAAVVAFRLQREAGIAAEETVKNFTDLGKDPLAASIKLNQQMRFLTVETYNQIKALDEQGRTAEAAAVAQAAFLDVSTSRALEAAKNVNVMAVAWRVATENVRGFGNAITEAFRPDTMDKQVERLRQNIIAIEESLQSGRSQRALPEGLRAGNQAAQEQQLESLREQLRLLEKGRDAVAQRAQNEAAAATAAGRLAEFDKKFEAVLDKKAQDQIKINREIGVTEQLVKANIITEARGLEYIANLRKSLADKGSDDRKNRLDLGIEQIKSRLAESISVLDAQQKILDARRSAGLIGESDYYSRIRSFVEDRTDLELRATDEIIKLRQLTTLNDKDTIDNQREIVKLGAERVKQARDAGTQVQVLSIQEQAAAVARVRAYEQARNAAQAFFDVQELGFARELQALSRGDLERRRIAGVNQISDRYAEQRRAASERLQLASLAGPPTAEARQQYDQQIALIDEFLSKSLQSWDNYYADLRRSQADWRNGATRALENYVDSVADIAGQTENLLTSAFKGAEDAFVEFARTGRLEFSAMADSIIADLIRIQVRQQITGQLAQAAQGQGIVSSLATVFGGTTANAKGNVYSGAGISAYSNSIVDKPTFFAKGGNVMGEAGPEAIMPLTRTPDGNLGVRATGGSGVTVNIIESNERGGEVQRRSNGGGGDILDVFVSRVKAEVANDIRRGSGAVPAAMSDTYGLNRAPSGY